MENPFDNPAFRHEFKKAMDEALKPLADHEKRIASLEKMGARVAALITVAFIAVESLAHKMFGGSGH